MGFQFHSGSCVEKCLRCGAIRKLNGIRDAGVSIGEDVRGWWELFPTYVKCSGHFWSPVSA